MTISLQARIDSGLHRIAYDPHWESSSPKSAVKVPWPTAQMPRPKPFPSGTASYAALPKADALVVTWTSGEARTMAQLFAGRPLEDWQEYTHNVDTFIPLVTGSKAPFNYNGEGGARYYHSLGLYTLVSLAGLTIVVLKSGLHPAYDGPKVPMIKLWQQMIAEVAPKLVITTGTAGGIGAKTLLGDVLIAANARFDYTGPLKSEPFAQKSYPCSGVDETAIKKLITPALLKPNGDRLLTPRLPTIIYPSTPDANQVTTDVFAFDDSSDYYGLQGKGLCCDMGDACLGQAIATLPGGLPPAWVCVRNASDPQIENSEGAAGLEAANKKAEQIYNDYQCITTAGSVVATWATLLAQLT
jgi:hypothetical protein